MWNKNFKKSKLRIVHRIGWWVTVQLGDGHTNDATTKPWVGRCEATYNMAHNIEAMFTVRNGRTVNANTHAASSRSTDASVDLRWVLPEGPSTSLESGTGSEHQQRWWARAVRAWGMRAKTTTKPMRSERCVDWRLTEMRRYIAMAVGQWQGRHQVLH